MAAGREQPGTRRAWTPRGSRGPAAIEPDTGRPETIIPLGQPVLIPQGSGAVLAPHRAGDPARDRQFYPIYREYASIFSLAITKATVKMPRVHEALSQVNGGMRVRAIGGRAPTRYL